MQFGIPNANLLSSTGRRKPFSLPLLAMGVVWAAAVITGMAMVIHYGTGPGRPGDPAKQWPGESTIRHGGQAAQLLVFAHPHCPCTRSSIGELAHIMTQCKGLVETRVLFFCPETQQASWGKSDLVKSAGRIPGVTVVMDIEGRETRRFGVLTSGHALLFDRNGQLTFNGGITESRGHAGDNVGRSAIVSQLTKRPALVPGAAGRKACAIYGCEILDEEPL